MTDPTHRPLTETQRNHLAAPLPRDAIRKLPGKSAADYVSGHFIISRLIEVFGPDGWADRYEAPVIREGDRPVIHVRGTLTAAGVTRGDIGVGVAANGTPDAFETAIKGAYTDCLKRCARKLGDSFGLALYEKVEGGRARSGVGVSTTALAMLDELADAASVDAINAWAKANAPYVAKLDPDEQDIVKGRVAERRRELTTAPALAAAHDLRPVARLPEPQHAPVTEPPALAAYRARIGACASIPTLVAAAIELGPGVQAHREAAWGILCDRAAALGTDDPTDAIKTAQALSRDPAHWRAAGTFLAALDQAKDPAAVKAVRSAHGAALAALPDALRADLFARYTARRDAMARAAAPSTDAAAALEEAIKHAEDIPSIEAVGERIETAVRQGTITAEQAKALAKLHDARCSAFEREPVAEAA